jgi:hypothetical protein
MLATRVDSEQSLLTATSWSSLMTVRTFATYFRGGYANNLSEYTLHYLTITLRQPPTRLRRLDSLLGL